MTREDKQLLLVDLCGRLPYGVILNCCNTVGEKLTAIDENGLINHDYDIDEVKPYLFPLSSMTEEQCDELYNISELKLSFTPDRKIYVYKETVDWFNKNHIDYRGLIPKGLAIDCTNLNIY